MTIKVEKQWTSSSIEKLVQESNPVENVEECGTIPLSNCPICGPMSYELVP